VLLFLSFLCALDLEYFLIISRPIRSTWPEGPEAINLSNLTGEGPEGCSPFQTNRAVRLAFMMKEVRNRGLGLGARMVTGLGSRFESRNNMVQIVASPAITGKEWHGSVGSTKQSFFFFFEVRWANSGNVPFDRHQAPISRPEPSSSWSGTGESHSSFLSSLQLFSCLQLFLLFFIYSIFHSH
jgi:hypothetical protein